MKKSELRQLIREEIHRLIEDNSQPNNINKNFWIWFNNSKVVDSKGDPLVCYHGTKSIFNTFKSSRSIGNGGVTDQIEGMYFTDDNDGASFYSLVDNDDRYLMSVFLSINNPYVVKDYKTLKTNLEITNNSDIKDILVKLGHDGLIMEKGFYSNGGPYKLFLVFDPNQIKSTNNNGNWSTTNDDIYS